MEGHILITALVVMALSLALPASAQTTYGSQLMTPHERAEHRAIMRSLPPAQREAYRAELHERMKQRAEEMGLSLPETASPRGRGMRGGRGWGYSGLGRWAPRYGYPSR